MSKQNLVSRLVLLFSSIISRHCAAAVIQNDIRQCMVSRCGEGPPIRFLFHLGDNDEQEPRPHESCTYPGFQLSCNTFESSFPVAEFKYQVNTSLPGVYLSFTAKVEVRSINYKLHLLNFSTIINRIKQNYASSSARPATALSTFKAFTLTQPIYDQFEHDLIDKNCRDLTFYNCSRLDVDGFGFTKIDSLSSHGFKVYSVGSCLTTSVVQILTSCTKLYSISDVPFSLRGLTWSAPDCEDCEAKGQYCKLNANSTTITQCFPPPKGPSSDKLLVIGKVGGLIFFLLIVVALCYAIYSCKQNKNYQLKIKTFLKDYKALKPTRYSYADIKKISNHFKFKLGQGGFGSVFKGQLSTDVVAVKILNDTADSKGSGEDFINEVSTIGLIHHVNVVRLVGYCTDGHKRALVYEFLPNNSLEKFVYSKENHKNKFLGWAKMQEIAKGI